MSNPLISSVAAGKASRLLSLCMALLLPLTIGVSASAKEAEEREVKADLSQSKAVFESERKAADQKDALKIEFDNGSHYFNLEYDGEDAGTELEAAIKAELFDLIEWRDVDGNGKYDPKVAAETVQKIGLGDLVSQSLTTERIHVEGVEGVKVVGVTAAPAKYPDLKMMLTLQMFGEFLKVEGVSIEPTSMKFDIAIDGFPYQETDTSLALYTKVTVDAKDEAKTEDEASTVAGRSGKYLSFFNWAGPLTVDGKASTVGHTIVKAEGTSQGKEPGLTAELYLLYPRGKSIVHDPILGIRQEQGGGGCTPF